MTLLLILAAAVAPPEPRMGIPMPRGLQRGTEAVLTIGGQRLHNPEELILYRPGLTVVKLEGSENGQSVKATLKVAADAPLGEHPVRLRTRGGLTGVRSIYVGPFASAPEIEPNTDFAAPQKIDLNGTIEGVIENEDVDYFVVEAKKGQRISAEVEGIRLGQFLFDPYVAILDLKRFELAASDDTALLRQDAFASVIAPADGAYVVAVRESAYGGNNNCRYRLHVGDFPRPTAIFPAGGKAGESLAVTFLGDKAGPIAGTFPLPADARGQFPLVCEPAPSPNWIRVSDFPNVMEAEPNESAPQATKTDLPLPLAFNGVIEKDGDADTFLFSATKGQVIDVNAYARRLRSPLDPVVHLLKADGGYLVGNDDGAGPDGYLRYTIPADGAYAVHIHDHLRKGGPDFVYRIEITMPRPSLSLSIPHVSRYDSQTRQYAAVPRGNRFFVLLQTRRNDFGGPVSLSCDGLPAGVTMHAPVVAGNVNLTPVVFEAAADAPVAGAQCDLRGRHAENEAIAGHFTQVAELVQGQPNSTPYYTITLDRFSVAVIEEAPFKISIVEPKIPLVRDGRMDLKIVAERKEGFNAPILVELPFRSPGMNANPNATIAQGQNEVAYPINAAGNAAEGAWKLAVQASADMDGGRVYVASPHVTVTVAPHLVTGAITLTTTEVAKPTQVVCKLNHVTSFDETAELQLYGLPNGCAAKPRPVTKGDAEIVFDVTTAENSPVGQHKSLFCQIVVQRNGEAIVQSLAGGGVLRIDKPRPAPVAQTPAPNQPAAPAPAEPKRLSRLEQLRLEAEQRAKEKQQ